MVIKRIDINTPTEILKGVFSLLSHCYLPFDPLLCLPGTCQQADKSLTACVTILVGVRWCLPTQPVVPARPGAK